MKIEDITDVAAIHSACFTRQAFSNEWINCNFNAFPRIRYFVYEHDAKIGGYIHMIIHSPYFDTSILRTIIDNPNAWVTLNHWMMSHNFIEYKPVDSIYLFFEYFGYTKYFLETPDVLSKPNLSHLKFPSNRASERSREKKLPLFTETMLDLHRKLTKHIATQLRSDRAFIKSLMTNRFKEKHKKHAVWKKHSRLITPAIDYDIVFSDQNRFERILFSELTDLFKNNFHSFVKHAATMLAWDELCSIIPQGISHDDVREILLGIWRCHYEEFGITLPLGKPAVGLSHYYKMDKPKNFAMGNRDDMVDADIYTRLILGNRINNEVSPIDIITGETPEVARARMRIVAGNIVNIEDTLGIHLPKFLGKICCVDKQSLNLIEILIPEIPIKMLKISEAETAILIAPAA